jgi:membrane protein DedA with SNARE-associated domain
MVRRYGERTVLIARCLPLSARSSRCPRGVATMPLGRFALFTMIGCVPWVLALTLLGDAVGKHWETLHARLAFFDYAIAAAVVVVIARLAVRARRAAHAREAASSEARRNDTA